MELPIGFLSRFLVVIEYSFKVRDRLSTLLYWRLERLQQLRDWSWWLFPLGFVLLLRFYLSRAWSARERRLESKKRSAGLHDYGAHTSHARTSPVGSCRGQYYVYTVSSAKMQIRNYIDLASEEKPLITSAVRCVQAPRNMPR